MALEQVLLSILGVWLLALSAVFYWFHIRLNKLLKGTSSASLIKTLEKVLYQERENKKEIQNIYKELVRLEEQGYLHVQKMGLIRFNPFEETGGDHSFSMALLNAKDTGVVITGLHSRERTRLYIKYVKQGKGEHKLSKEELKAIEKAQKQ